MRELVAFLRECQRDVTALHDLRCRLMAPLRPTAVGRTGPLSGLIGTMAKLLRLSLCDPERSVREGGEVEHKKVGLESNSVSGIPSTQSRNRVL